MREYKLILPEYDNDGNILKDVHSQLRNELIDTFGGLTAINVFGYWKDKATGKLHIDTNVEYVVALEPHDMESFVDIAIKFGNLAKQKSIYVNLGGDVRMFDLVELNKPVVLPKQHEYSYDVVG